MTVKAQVKYSVKSSAKSLRVALSWFGHFCYIGALFYLINPYVLIGSELRFASATVMLALGAGLVFVYEKKKLKVNNVSVFCLLILYLIALARIHDVNSVQNTSTTVYVIQSLLTTSSIIFSWLIADRIDNRKLVSVLTIVSGVCAIPIIIFSESLFNIETRYSFRLGVLNYDSYQTASQIVSLFAISVLSCTLIYKVSRIAYIPVITAVLACVYTVTASPARGEAFAFAAAVITLFSSAKRWSIIVGICAAIYFTAGFFRETVLVSRLIDVIGGDLGQRDFLFDTALTQFTGNISTFLIGAGMNGFQYFNGFPAELYPHNFLLEGAVSGGVGLLLALFCVYLLPIARIAARGNRSDEQNIVLALMIFLVIVQLKSGSIVNMWGLGAYTALFVRQFSNRNSK